MFFLFGSTWEKLVTHSKQLEYYLSEKNKRYFKFGYFIPWRGCLGSQILHQGLVMKFSLILTGSCSKVPFFLVKIFIYFKQQIHEINSFSKLEWLILKFCRKLGFISSIQVLVFLLKMLLFFGIFSSKIYFGAKLTVWKIKLISNIYIY